MNLIFWSFVCLIHTTTEFLGSSLQYLFIFLGVEYSNQKLKKYLSAVIHVALWSSRDQSPDVWRMSVIERKLKQRRRPLFQRQVSWASYSAEVMTSLQRERSWQLSWPALPVHVFMVSISGWFLGHSSPGGDRKGRQTDKAGEEDMQRENTRELWRGGEGVKGGSSESR